MQSSAEINHSASQGVAQGPEPPGCCLLANVRKGQRSAQVSAGFLAGPVPNCFAGLERRDLSTQTRVPQQGGLSDVPNTSQRYQNHAALRAKNLVPRRHVHPHSLWLMHACCCGALERVLQAASTAFSLCVLHLSRFPQLKRKISSRKGPKLSLNSESAESWNDTFPFYPFLMSADHCTADPYSSFPAHASPQWTWTQT